MRSGWVRCCRWWFRSGGLRHALVDRMRCPCCGEEHAEETVEGSPFSIMVCASMTPENWLLVQVPRSHEGERLLDLMVVPTALAATAREIQRPPEWVQTIDFSRLVHDPS